MQSVNDKIWLTSHLSFVYIRALCGAEYEQYNMIDKPLVLITIAILKWQIMCIERSMKNGLEGEIRTTNL